ncbi:MAG: hypothetical protein OXC31_15620 [Spirochaetaceae bacterium]|nr:hypothetical protein [Spirochaetaceae bacterium]
MEPPELNKFEAMQEGRAQRIEEQLDEIETLGPHFEAMEKARVAAVEGIVIKMSETAPWHVWQLWVYTLFLKAIEVYHAHFRSLMLNRDELEDELVRIRTSPEWAKIRKWREAEDGTGRDD